MQFHETTLPGVWLISPDVVRDERGAFARSFCTEEFAHRGLLTSFPQCNVSTNTRRGTLRGMHYQADPHGEVKLIRCPRGAIYDVILDLRAASPTCNRWEAFELTPQNGHQLYVPPGCAHGFLTLADDTEVYYQMGHPFVPDAGRGVRWNDPAFAIEWPAAPVVIAQKDASYPDYALCNV